MATVAERSRSLTAPPNLHGKVTVPSDKSIAHRALICAALAEGESTIRLHEPGADVLSTVDALRALGVGVRESDGHFTVSGALGSGRAGCGNSGTTMRLLAGALAGKPVRAVLGGDSSLSGRPMERVAGPLRVMGAEIRTSDGHAPLRINGHQPLRALDHRLPVASAQVLGAICLAALSAEGTTRVMVPGATRDHTERLLSLLGVDIARTDNVTTITGPARPGRFATSVPGDFSSAAAWIVAATIHENAEVTLGSVGINPTRTALIDVLREMGADITAVDAPGQQEGEPVADVTVRSSQLRATTVPPALVPALIDELPLLAVAMAAADGTSEVRGAGELRVKESDRIATTARALAAIGAQVTELPDGWRIARGQSLAAQIETAGDHRIAMAMAVAAWSGLAESVVLDDPDCVAISYPSFWRDAATLGAQG